MPKQPKAAAEPEAHQNAVAALKADHRKVEALFKTFKEHTHGRDQDSEAELVQQICSELIVHSQLEEEIFYPACREKGVDAKVLDEAEVEHDGAKVMITDLMSASPDDRFYDAKVTVLEEYIRHHVHEEEQARSGLFALAIKAGVDMSALGDELAARKKQLTAKAKRALTAPELSTLNFQPAHHSRKLTADDQDKPAKQVRKSAKTEKQSKSKTKEKEPAMHRQSRGRYDRLQREDQPRRAQPRQEGNNKGYDQHDEDYPNERNRAARSGQDWDSGDGYPSDSRQHRGFGARGREAEDADHRHDAPRGRQAADRHGRDNSDSHWDNERGGRNPSRTASAPAKKQRSFEPEEHQHRRSYRDEFDDHGHASQHGNQRSYEDDQRASRSSWSGGNRMRNHSQTQGGHGGQFRGASRGGVGSRNGARSDR